VARSRRWRSCSPRSSESVGSVVGAQAGTVFRCPVVADSSFDRFPGAQVTLVELDRLPGGARMPPELNGSTPACGVLAFRTPIE